MTIMVGEDGPSLNSLTSGPAHCRGRRTYVHIALHRYSASMPPVLTLLLFLLVQHASCKLREGVLRPAYRSEVVRHGGSLYQSEADLMKCNDYM